MVLETYNLSKMYKGRYAVKDVNMHIEEGDIYGFVGENGAGKTTIIRLINGLCSPTSGYYSLYNISSTSGLINNERRKIGAIVENVSLNKSMSALENLRFQSILTGVEKTDSQLIDLIESVGLSYDQIKNKKVGDYSLGMRQRIGIAIVMISSPRFVILDEPMNGLDPQGFIDVRETILKLNKEGVTFLISSHILSELDKICNKIGFISHGRLIEELNIDDLRSKSRKRINVRTTDNESFMNVLISKYGLKDVKLESNFVSIFDNVDINNVLKYIVKEKVEISLINVFEETIEDYYISLINKERANLKGGIKENV